MITHKNACLREILFTRICNCSLVEVLSGKASSVKKSVFFYLLTSAKTQSSPEARVVGDSTILGSPLG